MSDHPALAVKSICLAPASGKSFHLDAVAPSSEAGRYIAKLTEISSGPAREAETAAPPLAIDLELLAAGRVILELHTRPSPKSEYSQEQSIIISMQRVAGSFPEADDRD